MISAAQWKAQPTRPPRITSLPRRNAATRIEPAGCEAARALSAALPILARCHGEVILLSVGEREGPEKLGPVVEYLAMHGIAAQGIRLADQPHGTGALLLEEATRRGAGLLVMGAYTHTRWRESILGGVTDHILRHAALPVLFAH